MLYIDAIPGSPIDLGYQGENLARTIRFDISDWQKLYGDGEVILLAEPGRGGAVYPCVVTVTENIVEWPISASDTAFASRYGQYELQYRINDVVVKSAVGATVVHDALGEETADPPSPAQTWVEQVLDAAARAEAAADRAEGVEPGSASGDRDHSTLSNRDAADQHPISSITGLEAELMMKQEFGDYATRQDLEAEIERMEKKMKTDEAPTKGSTNPVQSGGVYTELTTLKKSLLPDVTTKNNGQVLMVVNGIWDVVDLGGV